MTINEKKFLYAYLLNYETKLKYDYENVLTRCRYRDIHLTDCFELAVQKSRLDDFTQFRKDILEILHMVEFNNDSLKHVK